MTPAVRPLATLCCGAMVIVLSLPRLSAAQSGAPRAFADLPVAQLFLELVVNGYATGRVVPVLQREGRYYISAAELQAVSIPLDRAPSDVVSVSELDKVHVEYDSHTQQLKLTVPPEWLPGQTLGRRSLPTRVPLVTDFGAVVNYDLFATAPSDGPGHLALWTGQRLFDTWGSLATNGVIRRGLGASGTPRRAEYLHYDTTWSYSNERSLVTYTAGDLITGTLPWSSPVRLGGISIARNFRIRPDVITYPVPELAGQAAVPTAVDVFINGSRTTTGNVQPGPFVIADVPLINGAGNATLVMTDSTGRRVSREISFYVANSLLRRGMVDFSASAGLTRRLFGVRSFEYGKPAGTAALRYGLTDFLTVSGHVEGGERQTGGSMGADVRVGILGVVSGAVALGDGVDRRSRQYSVDYSYTGRRFSVNLRHLQRGAEFRDLAAYDRPRGAAALPRRVDQATGALRLGNRGGAIGAGYFGIEAADGVRTTVANLSYSRSFVLGTSIFASVNRTLDREQHTAAQLQLVVPFGQWGTASTNVSRSRTGRIETSAQYSRSVPPSTGFGWTVGASDVDRRAADLTWRSGLAEARIGASTEAGDMAAWGSVSGALVAMGGSVHAANRVSDAFVLVDTDGHAGIPVFRENQFVGRTNRRGRLLVPWVTSYYGASYEIDPLDLPAGARVPVVQQRIAVHRQSGAVLRFPVEVVRAAIVRITDGSGNLLPVGAHVLHVESGQRTVVGWDGIVYFEGLGDQNTLIVQTGADTTCRLEFTAGGDEAGRIAQVGPIECR